MVSDTSPRPSLPPAVAIIANGPAPYRAHVNRRIAREIGQIRIFSLFTHDKSSSDWSQSAPPEINPVFFGRGDRSAPTASPAEWLQGWRKGKRIIQWLRENDVRLVIIGGYNDPACLRVLAWCRRQRIPVFIWADANVLLDNPGPFKSLVKKTFLKRVLGSATGVLACGRLGREFFLRYGARPEQIFYFSLESDYELIWGITPQDIQAVLERFNVPAGRRRFVFSGRLIGLKRVDLLLDAFNRIADQRPEWDLLIIGDGPLRDSLQARVDPALRTRVFWTGFLDDQQPISALYRASDVLVLPSDFDQWALVVNEAAAAGLAIVTSHVVGAAAELVRPGVNGYTFQKGDVNDLTKRLLEVTDPQRIDKMKSASAAVLSDWRQSADPVESLRDVLRKSGVIENQM